VLIGFGEATEPAFFVKVWASVGGFLCAVESEDEVMGELHAVEGGRGHFFAWSALRQFAFGVQQIVYRFRVGCCGLNFCGEAKCREKVGR